jgi:hypothetical protein
MAKINWTMVLDDTFVSGIRQVWKATFVVINIQGFGESRLPSPLQATPNQGREFNTCDFY